MNANDDGGGSELAALIEQSCARLFADLSTRAARLEAERSAPPPALWAAVAESGLALALVDAAAGGSGASFADAYAIFHALGRWQLPVPLLESMLAAHALAAAGIAVPEGAGTVALAAPGAGAPALQGALLDGRAADVPWAGACRWALVETADGALGLVALWPGPTLAIAPRRRLSGEPAGDLAFTAHPVRPLPATAAARPGALRVRLALAKAIAIVGALDAALASTIAHVNERVQFGRPLARFQSIQHGIADAAAQTTGARTATRVAAASAAAAFDGDAAWQRFAFDVAVAKVRAGEAATRTAWVAHQYHGAMGFTQEHDLHFATKRLWGWRADYGSDAEWAALLGRAAIRAGDGFWAALTDRRLIAAP